MDELSERGVHNPKVIDLISYDREQNLVTLTMIEHRPWGASEEQLDQLQAKFNNYVDYCLDGWLVKQFPQYEGSRIAIQIEGASLPTAEQERYFTAMREFCSENDIEFVLSRT